jgi:hypothetical protein
VPLADKARIFHGVLGVAGLPDWGSPGFLGALDQAKAGAADDILTWCPCALT